ncbi:MAG: hypothetical protein WCK60_02660 [Candidatus Nomurabacteria bacterium]
MTTATADAGHGHGDEGKKWWMPVAVLASAGLGLMLFFSLSGQPFAEWSANFAIGLTNVSAGFTNSRAGFMMLIQMGIGISAFIWLIKWAMGNKKHEQEIASLQAQLAAKKAKAVAPPPAATP